jgi:hypothetical protein
MNQLLYSAYTRYLLKILALLLIAGCITTSTPVETVSERANLLLFEEYSYSGVSLDISNETANARATSWRPDGSMIFITGRYSENVVSYTMTEPWDIGTATFSGEFDLSNEFGSTSQNSVAHGLFLHSDGELMWVFNRTEIWGYTLETPWELSSAIHTSYFDLKDFVQRGHDFDFNPEGTKLFIDDRDAQAVHEVHLSTPWDITTIEWEFTLDISDQENAVRGLEMILDGTVMLLMDTGRREVLQYHLSEPYNLKTASYVNAFDVSEQTGNPRGLSIRPGLEVFYITGNDNQRIFQYSRGAAKQVTVR